MKSPHAPGADNTGADPNALGGDGSASKSPAPENQASNWPSSARGVSAPPFHPLANLFPLIQHEEFRALVEDIRTNGLNEPIVTHDGQVLDGRNRLRACLEAGVEPRYTAFTGADPIAFVISANIRRRHLDASQRAMVAAELATMRQGERTDLQPSAKLQKVSQAKAAELFNVSARTVADAVAVREEAIPEIAEAVRQGHIPVSKAVLVARLPKPAQQNVAAELGNGKSVSTIVLGATRIERAAAIERASAAQSLSALGRTFPVLYADPPWQFESWSDGGKQKAPDMHYLTMPTAEICSLPVGDIAARDAVLFMWALPCMLLEALEVIKAWGFTFKTEYVWKKPHIACGHWGRGQHEPIIVAVRGDMPPPPQSDLHSTVFEGEPEEARHSSKPSEVRDWIASAYPDVGRIELFARTTAPGWATWGNQAPVAEIKASVDPETEWQRELIKIWNHGAEKWQEQAIGEPQDPAFDEAAFVNATEAQS